MIRLLLLGLAYIKVGEKAEAEVGAADGGLPRGWVCLLLRTGMLRTAGFLWVSPGAHRAAELPLSGIGKPGSGCTADFTSDGQEPLNREHIWCSW